MQWEPCLLVLFLAASGAHGLHARESLQPSASHLSESSETSSHCAKLYDEISEWEIHQTEAGRVPRFFHQGEEDSHVILSAFLDDMDITVARYKEDTSWASMLRWHGARVDVQSTKEAMDESVAFAHHLVDAYDSQRTVSVFLHGGAPTDWHSPSDLLGIVRRIHPQMLLKLGGYASLNLGSRHYMGQEGALGAQSALLQYRMDCLWKDKLWVKLLRKQWGIEDGDFADWSGYCCSQFAVHRDSVRRFPKKFYQSLLETMKEPQEWGHGSYKVIGRSMEYLWHVIFTGKPIRERHYTSYDFTRLF